MALLDSVKGYLPDINVSSLGLYVLVFLVFIVVCAAIGGLVYFLIMRKRFNKTIVVFEKVGKTIEVTRREKAMVQNLTRGGDSIFVTNKSKKYLPSPQIQTGRNTYWFYIREDGEWINFGIEDIDVLMRTMKAQYLDKEMRYNRTALQSLMKERYQKVTFWDKFGGLIVWTVYLAITGIMVYLVFDKFIDVSASIAGAMDTAAKVLEESKRILATIEELKSTGGLAPA